RDHRAGVPQATARPRSRHDIARSRTLHRDGDPRRQIRAPLDAAGRRVPEGSRYHDANAGRGRGRSVAEVACRQAHGREEISPQKTWRSQMSTMTINGRVAPLPDDPDALLIDL